MQLLSLPTLKRLPRLANVGETPVCERFTVGLLREWKSYLSCMARLYHIPRRLEPDDIFQNLAVTLWQLTKRCDPDTSPQDFERLAKAEIRNKCIDLARHAKAQKRIGRVGVSLQCLCCGVVNRWTKGDKLSCKGCNESVKLRFVDSYSQESSISAITSDKGMSYDFSDDGGSMESVFADHNAHEPVDIISERDLIEIVRDELDETDKDVFDIYVDTPQDFLDHLLISLGHTDVRKVNVRVVSAFFGISMDNLQKSQLRIASTIVGVTGSYSLLHTVIGRRCQPS